MAKKVSVNLTAFCKNVSKNLQKDMITEWTKTMDVLSKMWVKHVYNLDLEHLPLEKPSDTTRKRRGGRRKPSIEV